MEHNRNRALKLVAAHRKGMITEHELTVLMLEVMGMCEDYSIFDLIPEPIRAQLEKDSQEWTDEFLDNSITIRACVVLPENREAYRKEVDALDEAIKRAKRAIRDRVKARSRE